MGMHQIRAESTLKHTEPPDVAKEPNQASTVTFKMISHSISQELVEATQQESQESHEFRVHEKGETGATSNTD